MFILDIVRNIVTYSLFVSIILVSFIPVLILAYLPFSWVWVRIYFYKVIHTLHWVFLAITFLPCSLEYPKNPLPETGIFIANHESALDTFMIGKVLKSRRYSMLAKGELADYPVFGTLVQKIGIPVYFGNSSKRGDAIHLAVSKLKEGISIRLFPEGTRFNSEHTYDFKSGFAVIAKLSGKPVIPMYFTGAGKALPAGHKFINWHPLSIKVGDPFYYKAGETIPEFVERVREWFLKKGKIS